MSHKILFVVVPIDDRESAIVKMTCIGQRYVDDSDGVYRPGLVWDAFVEEVVSKKGAQKLVRSLNNDPDALYKLRHPTRTGSLGGPGYYPLSPSVGPYWANGTIPNGGIKSTLDQHPSWPVSSMFNGLPFPDRATKAPNDGVDRDD